MRCAHFEAIRNRMVDISMLQGYLMKEKSKVSLLHGLTGDINKRYFRVRRIEESEELALCYYKNISDPEVRGWIYLKDMTEIAENQDTMILTSVARTLHLYAQTRAQHNVWVTGLAKLCPGAFVKLRRNAQSEKEVHDASPTICSPTSPPKTKLKGKPSARDLYRSSDINADESVPVEPQVYSNDDGSSSDDTEDNARDGLFETSHEQEKCMVRNTGSSDWANGCQSEPGELQASHALAQKDLRGNDSVVQAGDERRTKGWPHKRRSLHSELRSQSSSSSFGEFVAKSTDDKTRTRDKNEGQHGRRRGSESGSARKAGIFHEQSRIMENSGLSLGDRDHNENECRVQDLQCTSNGRRGGEERLGDSGYGEGERSAEQTEFAPPPSTRDVDVLDSREIECTTDNGREAFRPEKNERLTMPQSRVCSSEAEQVETIRLDEVSGHNPKKNGFGGQDRHSTGKSENRTDNSSPGNEHKCSNQDADREIDEQAELDISIPPLETLPWEGPRQGQSATSRLHRHISGSDAEAAGINDTLPPPKEFLAKRSLKSPASFGSPEGGIATNNGPGPELEGTRYDSVPKPANGRRRSAADLEWSGGAEARDRPRRFEDKLASSANCGPVDLGDSEEDGEDNLDLEVEKQRRRANAAILALEAAAKEADEEALVNSRTASDCKRRSDDARGIIAKVYRKGAVPSPAGPPPVGVLRNKGRRGPGVSPVRDRVSPTKGVLPAQVTPANSRVDSDKNFVNDNWDDESKTPFHGSPAEGPRGVGGLPAAVGMLRPLAASGASQSQANHWMNFDD